MLCKSLRCLAMVNVSVARALFVRTLRKMDIFVQQILNGLVRGSVYAIIALGYTMVYGVLGIINFAHGDVLMVGAMVALSAIGVLQNHFPGLGNVPTLCIAAIVCAVVGYTIERVAYRPLRKAPRLAPLITAIGVSILLQTLAMMIWSRNPLAFPQLISTDPINVIRATDTSVGAVISPTEIVIIVVAFLVMACLLLLVRKTKLGRSFFCQSHSEMSAFQLFRNVRFRGCRPCVSWVSGHAVSKDTTETGRACQSGQRVPADRWPGVEGAFGCANCRIVSARSARVNSRCFFVPGSRSFARTATP
ncbi:hypothetical protein OKW34_003752 [Paraburkholderia youngii]